MGRSGTDIVIGLWRSIHFCCMLQLASEVYTPSIIIVFIECSQVSYMLFIDIESSYVSCCCKIIMGYIHSPSSTLQIETETIF